MGQGLKILHFSVLRKKNRRNSHVIWAPFRPGIVEMNELLKRNQKVKVSHYKINNPTNDLEQEIPL